MNVIEPTALNVLEETLEEKPYPLELYNQEINLSVYESINQLKNIYNYANTNIGKLSSRYNAATPKLSQYSFRPTF